MPPFMVVSAVPYGGGKLQKNRYDANNFI